MKKLCIFLLGCIGVQLLGQEPPKRVSFSRIVGTELLAPGTLELRQELLPNTPNPVEAAVFSGSFEAPRIRDSLGILPPNIAFAATLGWPDNYNPRSSRSVWRLSGSTPKLIAMQTQKGLFEEERLGSTFENVNVDASGNVVLEATFDSGQSAVLGGKDVQNLQLIARSGEPTGMENRNFQAFIGGAGERTYPFINNGKIAFPNFSTIFLSENNEPPTLFADVTQPIPSGLVPDVEEGQSVEYTTITPFGVRDDGELSLSFGFRVRDSEGVFVRQGGIQGYGTSLESFVPQENPNSTSYRRLHHRGDFVFTSNEGSVVLKVKTAEEDEFTIFQDSFVFIQESNDEGRAIFYSPQGFFLLEPSVPPNPEQPYVYHKMVEFGEAAIAPGLEDGVTFKELTTTTHSPTLNKAGHVVFIPELEGPGITSANNLSLWAYIPGEDRLQLIVRKGDKIDAQGNLVSDPDPENTTLKEITNILFASNKQGASAAIQRFSGFPGNPTGLSDKGLVVFAVPNLGIFQAELFEGSNETGFDFFWRDDVQTGFWSEEANWVDNAGEFVPRPPGINPPEFVDDKLVIVDAEVTVNVNVQVGSISAGGELDVISDAEFILGGAETESGPFNFNDGSLENRGTMLHEDGVVTTLNNYDIINLKDYTLKAGKFEGLNGSSFHNRGLLVKGGAGDQEIAVPFENELDGTMEIVKGNLELSGESVVLRGIQLDNSLQVHLEGELSISGPLTTSGYFDFTGEGIVRVSSPWTIFNEETSLDLDLSFGRFHLDEGASLEATNGLLKNNSLVEWRDGEISGGAVDNQGGVTNGVLNLNRMVVPEDALNPILSGGILNRGSIEIEGDLTINGGTIVNNSKDTLLLSGGNILKGDSRGTVRNMDARMVAENSDALNPSLLEAELVFENSEIALEGGAVFLSGKSFFRGNNTLTFAEANDTIIFASQDSLEKVYKLESGSLVAPFNGENIGEIRVASNATLWVAESGKISFLNRGIQSFSDAKSLWLDGGKFLVDGRFEFGTLLWTKGVIEISGTGDSIAFGSSSVIKSDGEKILRGLLQIAGSLTQQSPLVLDGAEIETGFLIGIYSCDDDLTTTSKGGTVINGNLFYVGSTLEESSPSISIDADLNNIGGTLVNWGEGPAGSVVNITGSVNQLDGDVLNGGGWMIGDKGSFQMSSSDIVRLGPNATVELKGVWINFGVIANEGKFTLATAHQVRGFNNASGARMTVANGGSLISSELEISQEGELTVDSGGIVSVLGGHFSAPSGGITRNEGEITASTFSIVDDHRYLGNGTLNAIVTNGGIMGPGASAGKLTIVGAFTQSSTGALQMELGGNEVATEYDQLAVDGKAALDGELKLLLIEEFEDTITNGDTFDILTATSIVGTFSNAANGSRITTVGGKGSFEITYSSDKVTVSAFEPSEQGEASTAVISRLLLDQAGQALSFNVAGSIGHKYGVETSTNMTRWELLHSELIDFDESFDYEYLLDENEDRQFFRIRPIVD